MAPQPKRANASSSPTQTSSLRCSERVTATAPPTIVPWPRSEVRQWLQGTVNCATILICMHQLVIAPNTKAQPISCPTQSATPQLSTAREQVHEGRTVSHGRLLVGSLSKARTGSAPAVRMSSGVQCPAHIERECSQSSAVKVGMPPVIYCTLAGCTSATIQHRRFEGHSPTCRHWGLEPL